MRFIPPPTKDPIRLKLARDHSRRIKQGYPWIYNEWFTDLPRAPAGSRALVRDRDGVLLAFGMYDPESPLAVRVCALEKEILDDALIEQRLKAALQIRRALFDGTTTGFRFINGEGDGLPGLVCDVYGDHAVLKLDGAGPTGFWNLQGISEWLVANLGVKVVYEKMRAGSDTRGRVIFGALPSDTVQFSENGIKFQANLVEGQKSGFFFDQRDNRQRIGKLSSNRRMLNLFGYTGGFSMYAGAGGARQVTTVDLAKPAIEEAHANWALNGFSKERHSAVAADVFDFLEEAQRCGDRWDLVVVDPPSFAKSEAQVGAATQSYQSVFASALGVLEPGGVIALSSCSSHISMEMFLEIGKSALSKVRRRATVLGIYGQPADHPFPFACNELQYLKFVLLRVS